MTVHRGSVNRETFLNDFNLQLVGFLDEEPAGKEATHSFSTVILQMERHKFLPWSLMLGIIGLNSKLWPGLVLRGYSQRATKITRSTGRCRL